MKTKFTQRQLEEIVETAERVCAHREFEKETTSLEEDVEEMYLVMTAASICMELDSEGFLPRDWEPDEIQTRWLHDVFATGQLVYREAIAETTVVEEKLRLQDDLELMSSIRRACLHG